MRHGELIAESLLMWKKWKLEKKAGYELKPTLFEYFLSDFEKKNI